MSANFLVVFLGKTLNRIACTTIFEWLDW